MPDLNFSVEKAVVVPYAAAPMLNFALTISNTDPGTIHTVALRCQIRIEPTRRRYEPAEQVGLRDLFGEPSRWGQTMHAMLWTHSSIVVPPFEGTTTVDLPVPCSYDFNLAATKYFHALGDGEVPLNLLFSGTIFYEGDDGDAAGLANFMGEGSHLLSSGENLERNDGPVLPEHGLALPSQGRLRCVESI